MESLISEIQIYPERQPNGQWLKSIKFKLPIVEEDMNISLDNDSHVETVCLLSKLHSDQHIEAELQMGKFDLTAAESKAAYEEIKDYVLEHTGLKVSGLTHWTQFIEKDGEKEP